MKWTTYINNITRKASSTLGFLQRNIRFCPNSCRKMAYIFLDRSAMEYSAALWDHNQQTDIDKLENVQRRAARFITQNYRDRPPGCVTTMLATPRKKKTTATYLLLYDSQRADPHNPCQRIPDTN